MLENLHSNDEIEIAVGKRQRGGFDVEGVDVDCTDAESAGPGDAVEEGSTFTDVPDADCAAC